MKHGDCLPDRLAQDLEGNYPDFMEMYMEEVVKFVHPRVGNNQATALQITGEVFIRVFRTLQGCKTAQDIRNRATPEYLYGVAKGVIKDYQANPEFIKRQKKTETLTVPLDKLKFYEIEDKNGGSPEQELLSEDAKLTTLKLISRLNEQYRLEREILIAEFIHELTYDEIEYRFHISKEVAQAYRERGIKLLKEILSGGKVKKGR